MYWNITDEERLTQAFKTAGVNGFSKIFLEDLLTKKEIKTCVKRLHAACMLRAGASYRDVQRITGLSFATTSRIVKSMKDREGGFQKVLYKMNPDNEGYSE